MERVISCGSYEENLVITVYTWHLLEVEDTVKISKSSNFCQVDLVTAT